MAAGDESILRTNAPTTPFLSLPNPIPGGAKYYDGVDCIYEIKAWKKVNLRRKTCIRLSDLPPGPSLPILGMRKRKGEMLAKAEPPKKSEDGRTMMSVMAKNIAIKQRG